MLSSSPVTLAPIDAGRSITPALSAASARYREETDDAPVSRADIAAAARAERARTIAVGAAGRKHAARERGDHKAARRELSMERSQLASATVAEERLAADREARGDQRWAGRALEETIALEQGRGEIVERRKAGGARILTRDGLETLARPDDGSQGLTSIQYRAGLLYRDVFEGSREELPSQLGGIQGGAARGATPFDPAKETWAQRRSRLTRKREEIHTAVRVATRDLDCVTLLQAVAGEGRSISRLRPSSGNAKVKAAGQLRAALEVVAKHFGLNDDRVRVQTAEFETADQCAFGDATDAA